LGLGVVMLYHLQLLAEGGNGVAGYMMLDGMQSGKYNYWRMAIESTTAAVGMRFGHQSINDAEHHDDFASCPSFL
jgi:hypothetical protein